MIAVANSLSCAAIIHNISDLKVDISKLLTKVPKQLEEALGRYEAVKRAIGEKGKELSEIYEILKAASSLASFV